MRRLFQIGLLFCVVVWSLPVWATCTIGPTGSNNACPGASCSVTMSGTVPAGSFVAAGAYTNSSSTMVFTTGSSGIGNWVVGSGQNDTTAGRTAVGYILNTSGSSSTVTCTASASLNSCIVATWTCTGAMSLDVSATRDQSTSVTNIAGVSPGTLTGTNDVIVQLGRFNAAVLASMGCPNGGTSLSQNNAPTYGYCYLTNTTNGPAGSYTNSTASRASLVSTAWKEAAAAGASSVPQQMLSGVGN